jgi:hypothetical protein
LDLRATTTAGLDRVATYSEGPLSHGIDVPVVTTHRRSDEGPAREALSVTHTAHRDVEAIAVTREGGELGGHHDGRDVTEQEPSGVDADVEPREERGDRLHGEANLLRVTRAVETDDEPIAKELVSADAPDVSDVLEALTCGRSDRLSGELWREPLTRGERGEADRRRER